MGAQVITTLLVGRDERDKSQTAQNQNIPNVWAARRTISSQEAWGGPFTNKEVLVLFDLRKCGPRLLPTKPSSQAPWLSYRPWVACGGQARGSIFCLGQSRMIASLLIDETDSAVVRTWAREVRLTWEICRPSGKTLALHRSWSTGSRGSHLNRKAPANTGGIKKAHKIYPIGGGQQLIALIFGKLEEVEEWTILVPRQTPSLLNCFFHGTQAFPVTQASTRDAKPYLVGGDPSTIARHLALSESEQDAPDRHQPRLKLPQLLKKL